MAESNLPPAHPLARFRLLSSPLVVPGKCAVCGSVNRPVVDFDMTLEFYGAVYLCEICLTEAGRTIGLVTSEEHEQVKADSARSFENQLKSRHLKAITYEQYDILFMAVSALSDVLLSSSISDSVILAAQTGETEPTLFDAAESSDVSFDKGNDERDSTSSSDNDRSSGSSIEEFLGSIGGSEQDDHPSISERPSSVSERDSDGGSFNL